MGQATGLGVKRLFTTDGSKAYDQLKWVKRHSLIKNPLTDQPVFEQKDVEFPEGWSLNAVNIVAQKYFAGTPGSQERESSLKTLIDRVVDTITQQAVEEAYFGSETEAEDFREELKYVLATQRAAFNSPVWFNIGLKDRPQQASACFILGVEDTMPAILNWYVEEGLIFKGGSGSGINLSAIRSSKEPLGKSAGMASGPLSFMRGADASAGAIKSGGKTRRAAKMVILNADHPDIEDFIWSKAIEGRKAHDLQALGWDMGLDGQDSFSVQYQNTNVSMRVTDDFMQAVQSDEDWQLKAITNGETIKTVKARDLFRQLAEAAWECGDPGLQYDTTANNWHTTPKSGRINGSNPFSEYMHLDNSACNLASLNLVKFLNDDNTFNIKEFVHTVELVFTAQEILVGYGQYPTEAIGKNSRTYRQLGIGYANLGGLLMAMGLPYDSDEARAIAAAITALLTGQSYATSAKLAKRVGPFAGFSKDRDSVLRVLRMHRAEVSKLDASLVPEELLSAAASAWDEAVELGEMYGVRNSQASVLAATGTIGLIMDCETTGIEPDLGLVKVKKLADGSSLSLVSQTAVRALKVLGYTKPEIEAIVKYIDEEKTILGAPHLKGEHEAVFACSLGDNSINYQGHVKMMAAVQPFISGAISKTINLPEEARVEDIEQLYSDAWRMGLKAIAIYRDNCQPPAPVVAVPAEDPQTAAASQPVGVVPTMRRKLPRVRASHTYKFQISDLEGYFTVGEYDDGTPGELFINVSKQGSTLSGIMDSFAISVSHGLQFGVPLKSYVKTLRGSSFAPSGITDDPDIRTASSITDYIFHRLALDYLSFDDRLELGLADLNDMPELQTSLLDEEPSDVPAPQAEPAATKAIAPDPSAPLCYNCGNQTQRSGSCYVCPSCGSTTGCS